MEVINRKLIIVLGMHRSGTSVVTRGLKVLGVELGHDFIPPQDDNVTGFWEDADLNEFNIELLKALNSDWHFLRPIERGDVQFLRERGYIRRGTELLRAKMSAAPIFGIKDPRMAKLLPFWQEVFDADALNVSYILVIRHPLSVCRSLEKRHGFDFEKTSLLWLEHVISSLMGTLKDVRVLVDYDCFIQNPDIELMKIATGIHLQVLPEELEKFKTEFLDEGLRHTNYELQDLLLDERIPPLVQNIYPTLYQVAASKIRLQDGISQNQLEQWETEFIKLKPTLVYIDKLHSQLTMLAERNANLRVLEAELGEIKKSRSWQVAMLLKRLRSWLAPEGSWREYALRDLYHNLTSLLRLLKRLGHELARSISFQEASVYYYHKWMKRNEPDKKMLAQQSDLACQFPVQPLISIITPAYHPPLDIFKQTIDSVIQQTYPNWELCVANASIGNSSIKDLLSRYAESDNRIRIVDLGANLGIAGNANAGIQISRGAYVAFLDHDDMLHPSALFEIVSQINRDPEIDVFYSDEDKIDGSGRRFAPFFKPCYSPDLLQSVNYMCHFLVVKRSLGDLVEWFRSGFEGSQDFDFVLRLAEKSEKIIRIPKILYHWRAIEGSTATNAAYKPEAVISGKRALKEHLRRTGLDGTVEDGIFPTFYRTNYKLNEQPLISIIIPNHNHAEDLSLCVHSILRKSSYPRYEILIVENNSAPGIRALYQDLQKIDGRIRVIEWKETFNYSAVNNWAVTRTNGEVLLFLNNDIEVINADWLEQMLMHVLRPEIGMVGAKLCYPDDTIQHAGIVLGVGGVAGHGHKRFPRSSPGYFGQLVQVRNVLAVTAACAMVRRSVFEEVEGFDPNYILAFGDVDLCLKIYERGYRNLWTPFAELYHHESKTRGYEDTSGKQLRFSREVRYFQQKWAHQLKKGDPYYNPNLSLEHEDYRINFQKHGN